jgi:hypothetical protein
VIMYYVTLAKGALRREKERLEVEDRLKRESILHLPD